MAREPQYLQGFREASKLAIKTIHDEANDMNDPRAKRILDSAGFSLGIALKKAYRERSHDDSEAGNS